MSSLIESIVTSSSVLFVIDTLNGTELWVESVSEVSELPGRDDATPPTFRVATLGCDPSYADWGVLGTVHVFHEAIVPGGRYLVQAINATCDRGSEIAYSAALVVSMSRWADVGGSFDAEAGVWLAPDESVDVATDVVSLLDKFGSLPGAPP